MVIDYLNGHEGLLEFYEHRPDRAGIEKAIELKKKHYSQRNLLCKELQHQYAQLFVSQPVMDNLNALQEENTFTVCTAHQPCLFTGPLYFIYKILHACKLAEYFYSHLSGYKFVPIYYMGSEDADLDELGTAQIQGKRYQWSTSQKGAVGRMLVDESLIAIIDELEGQLSVTEKGKGHLSLLRRCYQPGLSIAKATFMLVNELFQQYGLLVLNPDNAALKRSFIPVLEKELKEGFSQKALLQTIERFPSHYKVQTAGRPINLFYLKDQLRSRIEKTTHGYRVAEMEGHFTEEEMMSALYAQPECFSPNVILRPLLQEHLLPNVAFIGGGGELAYWLELKEVFNQVSIPYPVLILRNSFAILSSKSSQALASLELTAADFFMKEHELQKKWILAKEDLKKLSFQHQSHQQQLNSSLT